jgi:hypothetical protein
MGEENQVNQSGNADTSTENQLQQIAGNEAGGTAPALPLESNLPATGTYVAQSAGGLAQAGSADAGEVNASSGDKVATPAPADTTNGNKLDVKKNGPNKKGTPQPAKRDRSGRATLTGNFTTDELEVIRPVIDYRVTNGMSISADHFVRQCIDFAMCHGFKLSGYLTNLPKGAIGLFDCGPDFKGQPLARKGYFNT